MFYIQVSFGPQKITVECKLWCQNSYHMYVVSRQLTTRRRCLLRAVGSNGMFYVIPLFEPAFSRFHVGVPQADQ